jgi:hypothetical protein
VFDFVFDPTVQDKCNVVVPTPTYFIIPLYRINKNNAGKKGRKE